MEHRLPMFILYRIVKINKWFTNTIVYIISEKISQRAIINRFRKHRNVWKINNNITFFNGWCNVKNNRYPLYLPFTEDIKSSSISIYTFYGKIAGKQLYMRRMRINGTTKACVSNVVADLVGMSAVC